MLQIIQQELDILVNEKPVKQYVHEGRSFIESKIGSEYTIKLKNNFYGRVLAIVSVDGINVISGDPATEDSPGYIIGAASSMVVKGFRTSDTNVNAFEFSEKSKSYAAKSEQMEYNSSSCGVIGVKFFYEESNNYTTLCNTTATAHWWDNINKPYTTSEKLYESTATYTLGNQPSILNRSVQDTPLNNVKCLNAFDVGTKFSDKEIKDSVRTVEFKKGNLCSFVEVYYASRNSLEEIGIKFDKVPLINFPNSFTSSKYCSIPKK